MLNGKITAGFNDHQIWTVARVIANADTMNIFYTVQGRGAAALNGRSCISSWYVYKTC